MRDTQILATANPALMSNRELQAAHDQMMILEAEPDTDEYRRRWQRYLAAGGNRTMIDDGIDNDNWKRHIEPTTPTVTGGMMSDEWHGYYVVTPEYGDVVPVLDYGQGPIEYGRDVIEIEARNERDAIALGVREMLRQPTDRFGNPYRYCRDARKHGENPYVGVFVEPMDFIEARQ